MKNTNCIELGNKQDEPLIVISYCLRKVSKLWCKKAETKQNPAEFLSCRYETETRETRAARVCKPEYQTKERGLKFELWRSAEGPLSIQLSTIHTYI